MKIAILGCGPAGLFAAHAAVESGHDIRILSQPRKSFMRGAQYLHKPIPGLSGDPFRIYYGLTGGIEGYRAKVYGADSSVEVSPETLVGAADAWDIREAYDKAWELYSGVILPWNANRDWVPETFDMVFSTIPAKLLCTTKDDSCEFRSEMIYSTAKAEEFIGDEDNTVMCSGSPDHSWYRTSRIHGWETSEYPHEPRAFRAILETGDDWEVWEVEKPISTTCSCYPHVVRSGRYGKWTKGVLSHESYYDMKEALR